MKYKPILKRLVARTYLCPQVPKAPFTELDEYASQSPNTDSFIQDANSFITNHPQNPNINILPADKFNKRYNMFSQGSIGWYHTHDDRIDLRDGPLVYVLSTGLHECGEREFRHWPIKEIADLLGVPVDIGILDDEKVCSMIHNLALDAQILLTEKCEQTGAFQGKLRQATKELLGQARDIDSPFALDYLDSANGNLGKLIEKYQLL